ncbi:MAG TPA: hypothetical protein VMF30_03325, partial [Pirellulales bacterium]|nr:hypothetical protein [Pirellulales bacterium]
MSGRYKDRSRWAVAPLAWMFLAIAAVLARADDAAHTPLPGTQPLKDDGDFADRIVAESDRFLLQRTERSTAERGRHWQRDFSSPAAYAKSVEPNRAHLARIIGARDERPKPQGFELQATTLEPALVAKGAGYDVMVVAWPAFGDVRGEGLLLVPTG